MLRVNERGVYAVFVKPFLLLNPTPKPVDLRCIGRVARVYSLKQRPHWAHEEVSLIPGSLFVVAAVNSHALANLVCTEKLNRTPLAKVVQSLVENIIWKGVNLGRNEAVSGDSVAVADFDNIGSRVVDNPHLLLGGHVVVEDVGQLCGTMKPSPVGSTIGALVQRMAGAGQVLL